MLTDKAITMCLLEFLEEYSDANHVMSMKEIPAKMESDYGLKPDRRTIYSGIATLLDFGYDISTYDENGKGYFLRERDFEPYEITMLSWIGRLTVCYTYCLISFFGSSCFSCTFVYIILMMLIYEQ